MGRLEGAYEAGRRFGSSGGGGLPGHLSTIDWLQFLFFVAGRKVQQGKSSRSAASFAVLYFVLLYNLLSKNQGKNH